MQTKILQDLLDICTGFVSKHATLPILENIYIKSGIDSVVLKATDMEKHIEVVIPAKIDGEWAITINARTLSSIIRAIEDEHVQLLVENESLSIKSSSDNFQIKWISSTEYVALPEVKSESTVDIDAQAFITGIQKVEYTVSEKNFSPVLTGVYIRTQEIQNQTYVIFAWSDSFRLAEYKVPVKASTDNFKIIIPKNNIGDIMKVIQYLGENDWDTINIQFSDNMISRKWKTSNNIELLVTSLLIQWNFPDYNNENILPTKFNTTILIDKEQLEKAVKKILIITKDINNYVLLETKKDTLHISSGNTDKGEANTNIAAIISWEDQKIWINGKYINEFVRNITSNEVAINIVDHQKPMVFKDTNDDLYSYIARPLLK